jgi:FtsP/CotA-like multicopper oxidase with cupredoxin domain
VVRLQFFGKSGPIGDYSTRQSNSTTLHPTTIHKGNPQNALFLAPAERADTIIDFTNFAGQTFTLRNDAPAPYPSGMQGTLDPDKLVQVMRFRVNLPLSSPDRSYNPASGEPLRGGRLQPPPIVRLANPQTGTLAIGVKPSVTCQLVLISVKLPDPVTGSLVEILLNNTKKHLHRQYVKMRVTTGITIDFVNAISMSHPEFFELTFNIRQAA